MRLEVVSIKRFRSIEDIKLADCGDFNVLIGKNNSGKSNILSAIQTFFICIQNGDVITFEPHVDKEIDFFNRQPTQQPIEIVLTFLLSLAERDALIQDIASEAPQVRNAIEGIDPSLKLNVNVSITPAPTFTSSKSYFGYVSRVALVSVINSSERERIILKIGEEAARELYGLRSRSRQLDNDVNILYRLPTFLDDDDWRVLQADPKAEGRPRTSLRSFLSRFTAFRSLTPEINEDLNRQIESIFKESSSFEVFQRHIMDLAKKKQEDAVTIKEEPLRYKIDTFAGEGSSIPAYVRNLLQKISQIKVLYLKEQRKQIGGEEAARLLALKTRRRGPEVLKNIQDVVSALLGVKIDAFSSDSSLDQGKQIAELDVDDFLVEVNGSGIKEALRLVFDVEFERPHILLVEEPEIHLHPSLETSMMQYLKQTSAHRQVFITTHSTNFLDTTEMKNVYLVSKPESTQVQLLDFEAAASEIPRELGIRLSSLFLFDRLVFVEGSSDEDIIREWASTMGVNLNQHTVGFIRMKGARNIIHYAAEATLSFLRKRQVKMWFLLDRDEKDAPEIARLEKDLGPKVSIKVLRKREIENYLVCPQTVAKFIKLKREVLAQEKGGDELEPSIVDLEKVIDECAEELRQFTIDKRVVRRLYKPIRPSFDWVVEKRHGTSIMEQIIDENHRMMKQIEKVNEEVKIVYEEQANEVNAIWQSRKLELVPGDHLLDMVCRKYKTRFKKDTDGSRLAALMSEQEIDEEIKEIIREIGG